MNEKNEANMQLIKELNMSQEEMIALNA